ncbi:hypothetical protein ALT_1007 [Aspergillus lentulus]|uniref:Uncharacterized protein n=1 Tax=Aspergillus lentulus TaxID=293939 RepID=A0AAN4PCM2_ASPLE|nr:hypothetical protein ALT_1007 [Aspergillus lentulus]
MQFSQLLSVAFATVIGAQSPVATLFPEPRFIGPLQQFLSADQCVLVNSNTIDPNAIPAEVLVYSDRSDLQNLQAHDDYFPARLPKC